MILKNAYLLTVDRKSWETAKSVLICLDKDVSAYVVDNAKAAFEKWKRISNAPEDVVLLDYVSLDTVDMIQ